jgi:hypothetical protein
VKGETVHAIFAQIKQQRAKQYQSGFQRDDAEQPGERFSHYSHHECRNAAVTKKYEKHFRCLPESGGQSRVFRFLPQTTGAPVSFRRALFDLTPI